MTRKQDLLLGPLDGGCEMKVISFLELLSSLGTPI